MITCRQDIDVHLKHPLDILVASFERVSRLSSTLLLAEIYAIQM